MFLTLVIALTLCLSVTSAFADPGDEHRSNNEGEVGQGEVVVNQHRLN